MNDIDRMTAPQPPAEAQAQVPSYDALLIIAQSVCGALERAGITDCDDPGEAIDVLRERYEAQAQGGGDVAWSTNKPSHPGVYGVRGFNLGATPEEQFEAIVAVRLYEGDLICNLHESTSEDDFDRWTLVEDCNDGFEWCEFTPASAPPSAPVGVAGDTVGLHVLTGVFDKHGEELRAGDRIVTRLEGEHTKPEYWNPEYVIAWAAPRFTLRHVGGGLDSDTARWYFGLGTEQGYRMLELLDRPAALAQQPAPVAPVGVAYLDIGVGGYMDLGTEMSDEELAKLPNGRHVLGIIGTHGVDGYTLAQQPAAVDGECVDWRAMYRFQTAMRYMDNNPNLSKQKADRMADDDVAGLESANATQPGGSDNDQ